MVTFKPTPCVFFNHDGSIHHRFDDEGEYFIGGMPLNSEAVGETVTFELLYEPHKTAISCAFYVDNKVTQTIMIDGDGEMHFLRIPGRENIFNEAGFEDVEIFAVAGNMSGKTIKFTLNRATNFCLGLDVSYSTMEKPPLA